MQVNRAIRGPPFQAMLAGNWERKFWEQAIGVLNRTTRDEGDGATKALRKCWKQRGDTCVDAHIIRRRREVKQRPVDVEEQRVVLFESGRCHPADSAPRSRPSSAVCAESVSHDSRPHRSRAYARAGAS